MYSHTGVCATAYARIGLCRSLAQWVCALARFKTFPRNRSEIISRMGTKFVRRKAPNHALFMMRCSVRYAHEMLQSKSVRIAHTIPCAVTI